MTKPIDHAAPTQKLRIAVIGMGGIGSAFAFQLVRIGHHEVTAIARPGSTRLEQLKRAGGVINTKASTPKCMWPTVWMRVFTMILCL